MILTGSKIIQEVKKGNIVIFPFKVKQIGPDSYTFRMGSKLKKFTFFDGEKSHFKSFEIPEIGYVLESNKMYSGHTLEVIGSKKYAMSLIGRSSLGRIGLFLQLSEKLGHTTSQHQWILEMYATQPIKIYPGMIIGQVSFWTNYGRIKSAQGHTAGSSFLKDFL